MWCVGACSCAPCIPIITRVRHRHGLIRVTSTLRGSCTGVSLPKPNHLWTNVACSIAVALTPHGRHRRTQRLCAVQSYNHPCSPPPRSYTRYANPPRLLHGRITDRLAETEPPLDKRGMQHSCRVHSARVPQACTGTAVCSTRVLPTCPWSQFAPACAPRQLPAPANANTRSYNPRSDHK